MVVRTSEGKFLEVLESTPALDTGIEVDVFDGANPATMLATFDGAFGKRFTRELSELGSGSFALARNDPKATDANLAIGNLVKFRVAGTHRHAIWIEEPATTVVSTREEGGEQVRVDGRGILAYLERAAVYPPVWPTAPASVVAASSADNGSAGTTSLAVPKPTGSAAGDVVVVEVLCVGATPSAPTGWKRIRNVTTGSLRAVLYRKRLLASEPASWTWNWAAVTRATGAAVTLRNASSDDTTWAIADTTGSGTAIELPTVSVGLVDGVLIGLAGSAASTTIAPGAGLTELVDRAQTGRTLEVAALANPALGETGDLTATAGSSAAWIGLQVVVPSTASADAIFDGATFGAVLATLIDEAQSRGTIPALTYDFTADVDSHGEPWPDVHDLAFHVGTNLLEVWRHLVTLGLEGGMTPELRLQAFVDASRHFEDTVILRKGHHFAGDVVDTAHASGLRTRYLIEGAGGRIVEVTDPPSEADAHIGRREGFLELTTSDNPTTLQRAGEMALAAAAAEDQARSIAIDHGPVADGLYEPWVDYREGDWIGIVADGSGDAADAQRVVSITLEEFDAGTFGTEIELNSVELDAFLRLQRRLDALSRQSTASGSGGGGGASTSTGRVATVSTDSPGYLFDKITTDSTLAKTLVGEVGSQRVQLAVAPGGTHPDLATHDALGLATDAEVAAAVSTHAGLADPHPGYTTAAELASGITAHEALADPHVGYERESQKGVANGYAPLSSGVLVPVAYLGTGTPDGTKFLRDDGTWVTPAGSGGVTVADEGTPLATTATTLDFVGAGVVASGTGATKTVTISGGGSGVTIEEVDGTPTVTATKLVLPNGTLGVVGSVATYTPASASSDYVSGASGTGQIIIPGIAIPDRVPASPSAYDDEFDTTDTSDPMTGWTTMGTLDALDINSSAASHLRMAKTATGGFSYYGVYKAAPSMPFTVTCKVTDMLYSANYQRSGLILLEGSGSNKIFEFGVLYGAGGGTNFGYGIWTNRTSRASWGGDQVRPATIVAPVYLRLVVTSSTSVATYFSRGGLAWIAVQTGINPGFTIANVGLGITGEDNSVSADSYFDWIRFT